MNECVVGRTCVGPLKGGATPAAMFRGQKARHRSSVSAAPHLGRYDSTIHSNRGCCTNHLTNSHNVRSRVDLSHNFMPLTWTPLCKVSWSTRSPKNVARNDSISCGHTSRSNDRRRPRTNLCSRTALSMIETRDSRLPRPVFGSCFARCANRTRGNMTTHFASQAWSQGSHSSSTCVLVLHLPTLISAVSLKSSLKVL